MDLKRSKCFNQKLSKGGHWKAEKIWPCLKGWVNGLDVLSEFRDWFTVGYVKRTKTAFKHSEQACKRRKITHWLCRSSSQCPIRPIGANVSSEYYSEYFRWTQRSPGVAVCPISVCPRQIRSLFGLHRISAYWQCAWHIHCMPLCQRPNESSNLCGPFRFCSALLIRNGEYTVWYT